MSGETPLSRGLVTRQPTISDLSICAIEDAARFLGPSFTYSLWVSPKQIVSVRFLIRKMGANVQDSPLAPYINLFSDPALPYRAWYLGANNHYYGNPDGI